MARRRPPPPCVPTGLSLVCPRPRLLLLQGHSSIGLGPRVASFTLIISYRPVSDYSHLAGSWRLGPQHINLGDTASGKTPSPLATCQRMGTGVVPFWLCGQRCRERLCAHFCGHELAFLSLQTWIETWGCLEDSRSGHTSRAQDSVGHVVTSELVGR